MMRDVDFNISDILQERLGVGGDVPLFLEPLNSHYNTTRLNEFLTTASEVKKNKFKKNFSSYDSFTNCNDCGIYILRSSLPRLNLQAAIVLMSTSCLNKKTIFHLPTDFFS